MHGTIKNKILLCYLCDCEKGLLGSPAQVTGRTRVQVQHSKTTFQLVSSQSNLLTKMAFSGLDDRVAVEECHVEG